MSQHDESLEQEAEETERWRVLAELEGWLERPMLVLSFLWLCLVLVELVWTSAGIFEFLGVAIWVIFILEFLLRLLLAPRKGRFLRRNVITVIALMAPALRFLSALRFLRMARGLRLVRIVGTANRRLNAMRRTFARRGLGYVLSFTALVILLGAGGMLTFEPARDDGTGFTSYWHALWWTAMLVTTMGSETWPYSPEGRMLTLLISVYGFAVFGYITAMLASLFIGQDAEGDEGELAGARELRALRDDIAALRQEMKEA